MGFTSIFTLKMIVHNWELYVLVSQLGLPSTQTYTKLANRVFALNFYIITYVVIELHGILL